MFNIEFTVASFFGKTPEALHSSSNRREFVLPRHLAWYLMKKLHKQHIGTIALRYRKDYNTIRHGIRCIKNLVETDKAFAEELKRIESLIN